VTGASEDGESVDVAGRTRPRSKSRNRPIRSAWGVVKRARHPKVLARGQRLRITERTWVPVVEVSLAESRSHASLVDDPCVRREAWSQAARERRSGLDLVTESLAHLSMGCGARPR